MLNVETFVLDEKLDSFCFRRGSILKQKRPENPAFSILLIKVFFLRDWEAHPDIVAGSVDG